MSAAMLNAARRLDAGRRGEGAQPAGLSRSVLACLLGASVLGLLTSNPALTATAFLVLIAVVVLLWRTGAPPVLLFIAGIFWLQAATKVLHADLLGIPVADMALNPATIDDAILLSLLSVLGLAAGMRIGMGRPRPDTWNRVASDTESLSLHRLWAAAVVVWIAALMAGSFAFELSAARQLLLALASVKWVFIFALACVVFLRRRGYGLLGVVVLAELVVGFTGFFAEFKEVLFVLVIAVLTVRPHLSLKRLPTLLAGVALILGLGLVWTTIKPELREFLNAGTGQQVVLRSPTERVLGLLDRLGELEVGEVASASERLAERLAYVDYFAVVLGYVPSVRPHEGGALLGSAVRHVLTPRLLFPNKPPLPSDSEITSRYTGLNVPSDDEGTSINVGLPAEAYIDFGPIFMFLPILGIGLLCGLAYRVLTRADGGSIVLSYGFAIAVLIDLPNAGAISKLSGALLARSMVLLLIKRFAGPLFTRTLHRGSSAP